MSAFDNAFEKTVGLEGGYSDRPDDRGGKTMYGITEAVARLNGYAGEMKDLPLYLAQRIYRLKYWEPLLLDAVATSSQAIALEMFDTAVNCGVGTEARFLQRSLNALNRGAADFPDVAVDGVMGTGTVNALRTFLIKRGHDGETVLLALLNALQAERYLGIAEKDATQEANVYGWVLNRIA